MSREIQLDSPQNQASSSNCKLGNDDPSRSLPLKNPPKTLIPNPISLSHTGTKKLTLVPLIFIIFFEVAGGAYGTELAVQSAGPLFALIGFLVFPFIWSMQEALITAELSSALPGNGGFVIWAERAFGPFSGSLMGTWKYLSGIINGASFPALFADYLSKVYSPAGSGTGSSVTITLVNVLLSFLNYTGLSIVGWAAVVLGIAALSPFILMCGISIPKIKPKMLFGRVE